MTTTQTDAMEAAVNAAEDKTISLTVSEFLTRTSKDIPKPVGLADVLTAIALLREAAAAQSLEAGIAVGVVLQSVFGLPGHAVLTLTKGPEAEVPAATPAPVSEA